MIALFATMLASTYGSLRHLPASMKSTLPTSARSLRPMYRLPSSSSPNISPTIRTSPASSKQTCLKIQALITHCWVMASAPLPAPSSAAARTQPMVNPSPALPSQETLPLPPSPAPLGMHHHLLHLTVYRLHLLHPLLCHGRCMHGTVRIHRCLRTEDDPES